jgi:hypothetical protein
LTQAEDHFVPQIKDGLIRLSGFMAASEYHVFQYDAQTNQGKAAAAWRLECDNVSRNIYSLGFDDFRLRDFSCGSKMNISGQSNGYFFVSEASIDLAVDGEETYEGKWGAKIVSGPFKQGEENWLLFRNFNQLCFEQIYQAAQIHGSAFLGGDCGQPVREKAAVYQVGDHSDQVLVSQPRFYLSQNSQPDPTVPTSEMGSVKTLVGHPGFVFGLEFTQAGNIAHPISFDSSGYVVMWDLQAGMPLWSQSLRDPSPGHPRDERPLTSLAVSAAGDRFLIGGDYGFLQLRRVNDGSLISEIHVTANGGWHYTALAFDRNSRYALAVGESEISFNDSHNSNSFDTVRIAYRRDRDVQVELIDLESNQVIQVFKDLSAKVLDVGFAKDDSHFFLITAKEIAVYEVLSKQKVYELSVDSLDPHINHPVILGATFSKSLEYLAVSTLSGVTLLDVETNLPIVARLKGPQGAQHLSAPVFTEGELTLLASTAFGDSYEWDIQSARLVKAHRTEAANYAIAGLPSLPISFSPDGRYQVQGYDPLALTPFSGIYLPPIFGTPGLPPAGPTPVRNGLIVFSRY